MAEERTLSEELNLLGSEGSKNETKSRVAFMLRVKASVTGVRLGEGYDQRRDTP